MSESEVTVNESTPEPGQAVFHFVEGYDPSNGGDIMLRSTDNVRFMVHSTFLRSVSPVISSMIPPSKPEGQCLEIQLPQHSSVLIVVLNFLTQRPGQPLINDFPFLSLCLHASITYKLCSMTAYLRSLLLTPNSPVYFFKCPIDVYNISTIYNFEYEKNLAFQHCIGAIDLRNTTLMNLSIMRCRDTGIALQLVSRIARRNTIILETLSALHLFPMDLRSTQWEECLPQRSFYEELVCNSCRTDTLFEPASWQSLWAHFAKEELLRSCGSRCDHVFKVQFLCMPRSYQPPELRDGDAESTRINEQEKMCRECLGMIVLDGASYWEEWANTVKSVLSERLGGDF